MSIGAPAGRPAATALPEATGHVPEPDRPIAPWTWLALSGAAIVGIALLGLPGLLGWITIALEALFVVFFARHLLFTIAALRLAPYDLDAEILDSGYRPSVTVMVACHNEQAVIGGLLTSLLRLEYPRQLMQIVIVDDGSDDGTGAMLDAASRRNARLSCLHRPIGSPGGKSGALNAGLSMATGEIIVVFDADHRPKPDVVRRLVRHFEDPSVSAVQGRCLINNDADTPLTTLIGIDYMAGYLVNEYGRQAVFGRPAYGGANCAVRASRLRQLGGWNPESVTEDTDLTLRLALLGDRCRYDITAIDEEEGVVTLRAYWRQRYRWARGHQQVWRTYRRAVWQSKHLTPLEKVETTMFLLAFHLPAFAALGTGLLVLWMAGVIIPAEGGAFALWTLLYLGPLLELGAGMLIARVQPRHTWHLVYFLPLFIVSMALCTKAWLDAVFGRAYAWVKTRRSGDDWFEIPAPDSDALGARER